MLEKHLTETQPDCLSRKTVCGRKMTAEVIWYPHATYQNETIYFCTEYCLDAFAVDPDRFYAAHREKQSFTSE
jgi:YHS domain-containing protein